MSEPVDPFDVLKDKAVKPAPTSAETAQARAALEQAIALEHAARDQPPPVRRWRTLVAFAAGVAVLLVALPFLYTNPAQAALQEVAQAARTASPLEVPEGSFLFTRSERVDLAIRPGEEFGLAREFVAYHLRTTRSVWRSPAEDFILIHTTVGEPEFFDPEAEAAYYAAGLDQIDQVGETIIERFTQVDDPIIETVWPTNPRDLREAMEAFLLENRNDLADPNQLFDLAADLLRETHPSPQLRGALLEVLAELPLELEGRNRDELTVAFDADDRRSSLTLSTDGELLLEIVTLLEDDAELRVPGGTIISRADYGSTDVVTTIPEL